MGARGLRDPISRRDLIKTGLLGAAGLTALPALIAACKAAGATLTPTAPPTPSVAPTPTVTPIPKDFLRRKLAGQLNLADAHVAALAGFPDAPARAGMDAIETAFETLTGLRPNLKTSDPSIFRYSTATYLEGAPDDLFTFSPGYRMRSYVEKGLVLPIDEVWDLVKGNFSPGIAAAVTGDDGRVYGIPMDHYPWAMFYRKSVWAKHGYEVPATWDQLLALCKRMKSDGLTPIAFGDLEGWGAYGTFDMLNLRLNGYQFHMDLLRGNARWTDKRVGGVFNAWTKLVPYYTSGFQGLTWQQACHTLIGGQAGMYHIGLFMTDEVAAVDKSVLDDIDFFEFPYFGTEYDAERAVEAPMNIWAMSARSPTLDSDKDNARAYLEFWAQGSTQLLMYNSEPRLIPAASDLDVSKLDRLSAKSLQLVGRAQHTTNYFDRDTRPDFAGGKLAGDYLISLLMDPGQDVGGLQAKIQRFWDALPPYTVY